MKEKLKEKKNQKSKTKQILLLIQENEFKTNNTNPVLTP